MPSADITPKGKVFVMHETQFRSWQPGRFWAGTNFFCYGLGRASEFAVTNYNAGTPLQPNVATGIGFKSSPQFWKESKPDLELKLTGGQMAVLNHRGSELGSFSYSHVSFRLPGAKTRLTGGGWAGTRQLFKRNTGGFLAGIEHPIGKRWIVLSEWFSGRHDFGFFIPGILFHPTKRQIIVAGYKVANRAVNGKAGIVLEYGITF